jgi:hypothetical protein
MRAILLPTNQAPSSGEFVPKRALAIRAAPFSIRTPASLVCFALSAALLAVPIVGDRLLVREPVYATAVDVLLHLSTELLAGLALGGLVWVPFYCTAFAEKTWSPRSAWIRTVAVLVSSIAASLAIYVLVVLPSSYLSLFRGRVWLMLIAVPCIGAAFGFHASFVWLLRTKPVALALGLVAGGWALAIIAQQHFLRLNIVLHAAFLIVAAIIVSVAGGVAAGLLSPRAQRHLVVCTVAVGLGAIGLLYAFPGSNAARRAVLRQGGLARHATTLVVWPVADGDGDGIPSRFWGTDPDDRNPHVTPLTLATSVHRHTPGRTVVMAPGPPQPRVNLLWIVLDSVRLDTFRKILRKNERLRNAFSGFTFFDNYSACSSRTDQALEGLLGERRCAESDEPPDQPGLARQLDALGFESVAVGSYTEFPLKQVRKTRTDEEALREFDELMKSPTSNVARFVLLHLRGGHAPYKNRQSSEDAIENDLLSAAGIVEQEPLRDWVVVLMGDHGEAFGEHESEFHGVSLYEELLSTPFLIRSKRHRPGVDSSPAGCSDMRRQALFGLGILPSNPGLSGFKFATLDLQAGPLGQVRPLSLRSLRFKDTKIIWEPRLDIYQLYDFARDSVEQENLADASAEALSAAKQRLHRAIAICKADDFYLSH